MPGMRLMFCATMHLIFELTLTVPRMRHARPVMNDAMYCWC